MFFTHLYPLFSKKTLFYIALYRTNITTFQKITIINSENN